MNPEIDHLMKSPVHRHNGWGAARHRLNCSHSERLVARGQRKHAGCPVVVCHVGVGDISEPSDVLVHIQLNGYAS